jgi:short-subunit dehydrogenase
MSTVLITGASGGIGCELAKLFARDHHNLVLVARSADKLAQVAAELQAHGVTVKTISLDLAEPPAPKFLFDQLQREESRSTSSSTTPASAPTANSRQCRKQKSSARSNSTSPP